MVSNPERRAHANPSRGHKPANGETIRMMTVTNRTHAKRMAAAIGLAAMMSGVLVAPAFGHAAYKDSSPADKATVPEPPTEVWAEFTEPPESSEASRLEVYDPCGAR